MRLLKIMLIALVIGGVSLLSLNCTVASDTAPQNKTVAVLRGNLTIDITGVGNLALSQKEDLAFEIAGTVAEVLVKEGDTVAEGQVLARLDTSDWETQLSTLEGKVTVAERQLTAKRRALTAAERQLTAKKWALTVAERQPVTKKQAVTTAERLLATKKDAVTTAERLLATKKDAVTTAERLLATKKDAVTTAERLLATKKRNVTAKERDLVQAESDLKDAQTALDTTQVTYTEADFIVAQAAVDDAQTELNKAMLVLAKYEMGTEGYEIKRDLVISAQAKLKSAQAKLDAMPTAFDEALASNQQLVDTAQWNLESAQIAVEDATIAVADAEKGIEAAQLAVADAEKGIEDATIAVADAQEGIEDAQLAVADAGKGIEDAQLAVADAGKGIEDAQLAVADAQEGIEDAQLAVNDAQKGLDDARNDLAEAQSNHTEITAPSAGFITKVNVVGGDEVTKGTVAVTLADPNKFEADILVNETDIMQTKLGGNASVQVEAMPGVSLPAKVTHISPTAVIQSGVVNYKVKVELESLQSVIQARQQAMGNLSADNITSPRRPTGGSPFSGNVTLPGMISQRQGGTQAAPGQIAAVVSSDFQLREGQTVTVSILVAERNDVLLVPNGAITRQGMESMVKVLKDGVIEERTITTGISNWQYTEVSAGLSEGEEVVVPQSTTTTTTTSQQNQGGMRIPGMGGFAR